MNIMKLSKASVVAVVVFCLIFEQAGFAQVAPQLVLPAYLQNLAPVADQFRPVHLRSLSFDQATNNFNLLLDKGDTRQLQEPQIEETTKKLLEYFKIGLTLPNSMFWVNLRPDAPTDIIDPYVEQTDLGRILLEADLQLKKDMARSTSPSTPEGKQYWDKLYQKAESLYGGQDMEIPTLTRPWIVPGEIVIGESKDGAYVYKAALKVMLEQDYLKDTAFYSFTDDRAKELNEYSSQILRELIIPKLTREVNASKRYASLRQVFYSLVLAQWFKQRFHGQANAYASSINTKDLTGLTSTAKWSKDTYYQAYKKSFSQGEYKKEEQVPASSGVSIRSYFSGGLKLVTNDSGVKFTAPVWPQMGNLAEVRIPLAGTARQDGGVNFVKAYAPGGSSVQISTDDVIYKIIRIAKQHGLTIGFGGGTARRMLWLMPPTNGISDIDVVIKAWPSPEAVRDFQEQCDNEIEGHKIDILNFTYFSDAEDGEMMRVNPKAYDEVDGMQTLTVSRIEVYRAGDRWSVRDGTRNGDYIQDVREKKLRLLPQKGEDGSDRFLGFEGVLRIARIMAEIPDPLIDSDLQMVLKDYPINKNTVSSELNFINDFVFLERFNMNEMPHTLKNLLKLFIHARSAEAAMDVLKSIGQPVSMVDLFGTVFDLRKTAEVIQGHKGEPEEELVKLLVQAGALKKLDPDKALRKRTLVDDEILTCPGNDNWGISLIKIVFQSGRQMYAMRVQSKTHSRFAGGEIYRKEFGNLQAAKRFISEVLYAPDVASFLDGIAGNKRGGEAESEENKKQLEDKIESEVQRLGLDIETPEFDEMITNPPEYEIIVPRTRKDVYRYTDMGARSSEFVHWVLQRRHGGTTHFMLVLKYDLNTEGTVNRFLDAETRIYDLGENEMLAKRISGRLKKDDMLRAIEGFIFCEEPGSIPSVLIAHLLKEDGINGIREYGLMKAEEIPSAFEEIDSKNRTGYSGQRYVLGEYERGESRYFLASSRSNESAVGYSERIDWAVDLGTARDFAQHVFEKLIGETLPAAYKSVQDLVYMLVQKTVAEQYGMQKYSIEEVRLEEETDVIRDFMSKDGGHGAILKEIAAGWLDKKYRSKIDIIVDRYLSPLQERSLNEDDFRKLSRSFVECLSALDEGVFLDAVEGDFIMAFIPEGWIRGITPLNWTLPLNILFQGNKEDIKAFLSVTAEGGLLSRAKSRRFFSILAAFAFDAESHEKIRGVVRRAMPLFEKDRNGFITYVTNIYELYLLDRDGFLWQSQSSYGGFKNSAEALQRANEDVFAGIKMRFNLAELPDEELRNLKNIDLVPFFILANRYSGDPNNKYPEGIALLGEILLHFARGNFYSWRYDNAQQLRSLTDEQIILWSKSSEKVFDKDSDETRSLGVSRKQSVKDVLQREIPNIKDPLLKAMLEKYWQNVSGYEAYVKEAGELIAFTKGPASAEVLAKLNLEPGATLQDINQRRKKLKAIGIMIRLSALSYEEAGSGLFLKAQNRTSRLVKQQSISAGLGGVKTLFPADAEVIGRLLREFAGVDFREVVVGDTDDIETLVAIGRSPVRTCQAYDSDDPAGYNKLLPAIIADGDKRVVTVVDKNKGSVIARAVIRLMIDGSGRPVLFLEKIYPSTIYDFKSEIVDFLKIKCFSMGIPLAQKGDSAALYPIGLSRNPEGEYADAAAVDEDEVRPGEFLGSGIVKGRWECKADIIFDPRNGAAALDGGNKAGLNKPTKDDLIILSLWGKFVDSKKGGASFGMTEAQLAFIKSEVDPDEFLEFYKYVQGRVFQGSDDYEPRELIGSITNMELGEPIVYKVLKHLLNPEPDQKRIFEIIRDFFKNNEGSVLTIKMIKDRLDKEGIRINVNIHVDLKALAAMKLISVQRKGNTLYITGLIRQEDGVYTIEQLLDNVKVAKQEDEIKAAIESMLKDRMQEKPPEDIYKVLDDITPLDVAKDTGRKTNVISQWVNKGKNKLREDLKDPKQIAEFLNTQEVPVTTAKDGGADEEYAGAEGRPAVVMRVQDLRAPNPYHSQRPFLYLWQKYNDEYNDDRLDAANIENFKKDFRAKIREMGVVKFVKEVSGNPEVKIASEENTSALVYSLVRILFAPDKKRSELLKIIYSSSTRQNVLTAAVLSGATGIREAWIRDFMRLLEIMGAVTLGSTEKGLFIRSVNCPIMRAWFGDRAVASGLEVSQAQNSGGEKLGFGGSEDPAPDMAQIEQEVDNWLIRINESNLEGDHVGAYNLLGHLYERLHEIYYGTVQTQGLEAAQDFDDRGQYDDFLKLVQEQGLNSWLRLRVKALHLTRIPSLPGRLENLPFLYRYFYAKSPGKNEYQALRTTRHFLVHSTYSSAFQAIIDLGGIASRSYYERQGIKKNGGEWGKDFYSQTPDDVFFTHYVGSRPAINGGFGPKMGFEYPVVFGIAGSQLPEGSMVGTMDREITVENFIGLDKITHVFVPYFKVDEIKDVLHKANYDNIEVLPLGFDSQGKPITGVDAVESRDGGSVLQKAGGIDFRMLASSASVGIRSQLPALHKMVPVSQLKRQWQGIVEESFKGPMPYGRICEYVAQCKFQKADELIAPVVDYIAGLMRVEESHGIPSSPQIIQVLILTQSRA